MDVSAFERELAAALDVARHALSAQDGADDAGVLLREALYRDWYCGVGEKPEAGAEARDMCEMLRAAHAGTAQWEDGWQVRNVSSRGRVAVARGRERRVVHVIDCLALSETESDIRPGDTVRVVARRDSESINPGDWVSFSESWHAQRDSGMLRIYWNITPGGAPKLVRLLTASLSPAIPFFLKFPRLPAEYDRRDAAVLYFPRARFAEIAGVIARAADALAADLKAPVPALTCPLTHGVGLAEDPGTEDQSFGTARCALVADGIARCLQRSETDPRAWSQSVRGAFEVAGIPIDRPWVDTATSPEYRLQ